MKAGCGTGNEASDESWVWVCGTGSEASDEN